MSEHPKVPCCMCGEPVCTAEDACPGVEMADGSWACSQVCWDAAADAMDSPAPAPPTPEPAPEAPRAVIGVTLDQRTGEPLFSPRKPAPEAARCVCGGVIRSTRGECPPAPEAASEGRDWEWEYHNLCKFADDWETRAVAAQREIAALREQSDDRARLLLERSGEIAALREQLAEARAFGEMAAKKYNDSLVLRCAFCGEAYPDGTPPSRHERLTAHVAVCEKHPMRAVEAKLAQREAALRHIADVCWGSRAEEARDIARRALEAK